MGNNTNLLARELAPIVRKGTEHELSDAFALADILVTARSAMDSVTLAFPIDLFVAVTLCVVHDKDDATLYDVLNQPLDPAWNSE